MAIKKASAKKPVKNITQKKPINNQQPAAFSILKWLFNPETPINFRRYSASILYFVLGFFVVMSVVTALLAGLQFKMMGIDAPVSFLQRLVFFPASLWFGLLQTPFQILFTIICLGLIGAFVFMPRAQLERKQFTATYIAGIVLIALALLPIVLLSGKVSSSLMTLVSVALFLGIILAYGSTARHMASRGVSKCATILSFPFGYSFFMYSGLFLPQNEKPVSLKIKWYDQFINFLLYSKYGIMTLAAAEVISLLVFPYPWAILLGIIFVSLIASIGLKRTAESLRGFGFMTAVINILFIIGIIYIVERSPQYMYWLV